jgi:hypothetical protein
MICYAVPSNILLLQTKFLRNNIGEGRTATTVVLAILVSSLRRCAPEWSAGQCDGQITGQDEIFRNFNLSFPKGCQVIAAKDSSRCDGTRYYFFDTYIAVNMQPRNFLNIHEFYGERTERHQRIFLELLHRQFVTRTLLSLPKLSWLLLRHNWTVQYKLWQPITYSQCQCQHLYADRNPSGISVATVENAWGSWLLEAWQELFPENIWSLRRKVNKLFADKA